MISILTIFFYMVFFFGLIGSMRGWQLEVIATTGLIGTIAALTQFGNDFVPRLVEVTMFIWGVEPDPATAADRGSVIIQLAFMCLMAFFSYQVVSRISQNIGSNRLGDRLRNGFQKRFIGFFLGLINGYLFFGSLWGFLEFVLVPGIGYQRRLPLTAPYPFSIETITRPDVNSAAQAWIEFLPVGWLSPTIWLLLFFAFFFLVIIALI